MNGIYSRASGAWCAMEGYRTERARCKRYVYGDQWEDPVYVAGKMQTESQYIRSLGQLPLKNNILRRILRNVVGLYRARYKVPQLSPKDSRLKGADLRRENRRIRLRFQENLMDELAPRLLEEFLISGMAVAKVDCGRILPVTADNFFFHSDGYDPRGTDIDLIGEIHHVGFGTLLERFCESAEDYRRIADTYRAGKNGSEGCRLTEVWHKETQVFGLQQDEPSATLRVVPVGSSVCSLQSSDCRHAALSDSRSPLRHKDKDTRLIVKTGWRRLWYASDGTLLRESDLKESHPYVLKAYPFLDGEVHSYISDLLDQQHFVNRLITLYDLIMRSSAKGVLLFPDESIPSGMDLQAVADEWSQFNGVIPYKARPGVPMPTQVSANSTNIGISELLKIEMQMLEDISGISPTLQGKLVANSTSGTLFAQQNEAAQTSLLDILRTFDDFIAQLASRL